MSGRTGPGAPSTAADLQAAIGAAADPEYAATLQWFFKTGPGEYGEGDRFAGVKVPVTRRIVRGYRNLPLEEIEVLLESPIHEARFAALVLLNHRVARATKAQDTAAHQEIVRRYLAALARGRINNWDLVDVSAEHILGAWLLDRPRDQLFDLAGSADLWQRRVAMIATFAFIKAGDATTTLALAERLLNDRHDLMQKAVGWMLREVGKRIDRTLLTDFLDAHAAAMGRTALSYATEHLSPEERAAYRAARPL
ncbi:DNA alkylation repair protein [Nocardioides limicola]|uniref:DNA alkylation repair protein n=1 Tax=Nocardioides limicola TaxID=2803368 RepID=UPI00193B4F35|nr:DNA alkylation repair protein [Nocardioides sp. DJM-14]